MTWALLAALAVITYWPVFLQPFISDDYNQLPQARIYGVPSGWHALAADSAMRFRATWMELSGAILRVFGFHALPFYIASVALHILATWLVYAAALWRLRRTDLAMAAAVFFCVYEGHQEAVMWISASMEILVFLFGMTAFLLWVRWLEGGRWGWYAGALAAFIGALLSKESSVVFPVLMLLLAAMERRWRAALLLAPFFGLCALCVWINFNPGAPTWRLSDGSFSIHAPFLTVLGNSYWRLLFPVGFASLALLLWRRAWDYRNTVVFSLAWMAIALLPYCFLTYMLRVPSRQTYIPSFGLAVLVAAGYDVLRRTAPRAVVAACVIAVLALNLGTIWVKKRRQFMERAEPTEEILALARHSTGPIRVLCFPYNRVVAEDAAATVGRTIVWDPQPACPAGLDARFSTR